MSEHEFPTREQAERIVHMDCDEIRCETCDASQWCWTGDGMMATKALSTAVLAMHDEIDALKALLHVEAEANNTARDEIDRLREHLRNVQGELLVRFDSHELPDLNLIKMVQRIDVFLSPTPDGAER